MKQDIKKYILLAGILLVPACASMESKDVQSIKKQLADMNKKIEENYNRLSVIQFMVDNHQRIILDLEKGKNIKIEDIDNNNKSFPSPTLSHSNLKPLTPPVSNKIKQTVNTNNTDVSSLDKLYNQALSLYNSYKYKEALLSFEKIIKNYPNNNIAENALYWTGECLYAEKNYKRALATFNQVAENYPKGRKISDTLLKISYCYLELKDAKNAKNYLQKVVKNYPFSSAGSKAEEKLKHIP